MNESKMIEVLARIEDERERFAKRVPGAVGFNMGDWYDEGGRDEQSNICGTTACLAGHAYMTVGWPFPKNNDDLIESVGAEVLGLSEGDAGYLFYLDSLDDVYEHVASLMGVSEQVLRDKVQGERA